MPAARPEHATVRNLPLSLRWITLLAWASMTTGEAAPAEGGADAPASAYVRSLAVHPTQADLLFAASPGGGLYRSRDGADSWQRIDPTPVSSGYHVVKLATGQPDRVFAGGEPTGVWVSDDHGETWRNWGPAGMRVLDIALDPTRPGRVWVLAPEGVWRGEGADAGDWKLVLEYAAWQERHRQPDWPADGPWPMISFQKITVDPHRPDTVLVGARWEGGYHQSDDGGETWRHASLSGLFRRADLIEVHPTRPEVWFAGTHHQGLFKSYNRGASWVVKGRGLRPQIRTPHYGVYLISGLAFDPHDPEVMYTGSDLGTYVSRDGGATWEEFPATLTCEFTRAMGACPHHPGRLYAGTNVGIYRSTDGGENWTGANCGLPTREVRQTLDVTLDGQAWRYAVVAGQPAVFRRPWATEGDWTPLAWLLYRDATALRWDDARHSLVLTTPEGEVRSRDGGLRWELPEVPYAERAEVSPPGDSAPVNLVIKGAAPPDDRLVDPLYRRPPHVSLQWVRPGYPADGSTPLHRVHWDNALHGWVDLPGGLAEAEPALEVYVEVRDFQDGTQVGRVPWGRAPDRLTEVQVYPSHRP